MAEVAVGVSVATILERQRRAFARDGTPSEAVRRDHLAQLHKLLIDGEEALIEAVSADFGVRSPVETRLTDLFFVHAQLALAKRKLKRWMRKRRVPTPLYLWPGRSRIHPQPLGVVGILGAWNVPIATLFAPMVCALAAGNRVILKPSEQAPKTADTIARLVAQHFAPEVVTTVLGGPEAAAEFAAAPFDHIFFTGSSAIGRRVAAAAAPNLTPVTLELGGKSPAILDAGCDLEAAAAAIVFGKLLNAGQACVGVDYVLAPQALHAPLAAALQRRFNAMYPAWPDGGDYTHIISQRHFDRLNAILDDARDKGAKAHWLPRSIKARGRSFAPVLLFNVNDNMRAMNEELFGPLLPVVACETPEDAIRYVSERDKPLALYWFGRNRVVRDQVLDQTFSGGVTVNGAATHVFQRTLPFGGVGPSGMGEYLGETGFRRLSKEKAIFIHGPFSTLPLLAPPYSPRTDALLRFMRSLL